MFPPEMGHQLSNDLKHKKKGILQALAGSPRRSPQLIMASSASGSLTG